MEEHHCGVALLRLCIWMNSWIGWDCILIYRETSEDFVGTSFLKTDECLERNRFRAVHTTCVHRNVRRFLRMPKTSKFWCSLQQWCCHFLGRMARKIEACRWCLMEVIPISLERDTANMKAITRTDGGSSPFQGATRTKCFKFQTIRWYFYNTSRYRPVSLLA